MPEPRVQCRFDPRRKRHMNSPDIHPELNPARAFRMQVSAEEWAQRVALAAAYRLVALYGWDDLVYTHLSARVPGPEHHFLINPYGMMFEEVTASSLVKIDLDGNKVLPSAYDVNPAGFTIHSAIHAARDDAHCVFHVHTPSGVAVSAQAGGLLPISQQSIFVIPSLAYHDYEGVALRDDEKPRLVSDLGSRNRFLMLRNHGLLTVADSVANAFTQLYTFERTCEIQIRAQAGGGPLVHIDPAIVAAGPKSSRAVNRTSANSDGGNLAWPALLRKLNRIDPSYAD